MDKHTQMLMERNGMTSLTKEISEEDILEILAEQEFRICLMELGVTEDDL